MGEINGKAFFGAVLRAVACTRNHNDDTAEYEAGVIAPAGRIREIEAEIGGRAPTTSEAEQVLALLDTVLTTKRTPAADREFHTGHISRVSGVSVVRAGAAV
ncbi:hypothetical protein HX744_16295 [Pseudonocardia sp. ICBG1122]|nr:hypothetical protein [Pseudonocardia pini]